MSTRSQILVDGSDVIIYRHSDGYPDGASGVLASLLPLVKGFVANRGQDPFYLSAQIVGDQVARHTAWADEFAKRLGDPTPVSDQFRYLGFGVEAWGGQLHGDIEFLYVVKADHVEVRAPKAGFWDNSTVENTRLVKRVNFDGKRFSQKKKK